MATGRVPTTANSPLTAKGDLFGYSTTQARVAVGNDGETLVADSSATTGLRYQGNFAAGKNKIINGDFGVWQRGTSFSNPALFAYNADRFYAVANHTGGTITISRQTFTGTDLPVAGAQYYLRNAGTSPTGGSFNVIGQRIENVQTFAGQTITVSFYAKADSARTVSVQLQQNFGSGGSAEVQTNGTSFSLTTSWARYSQSINVPSISGKTIGTSSFLGVEIVQPVNVSNTIDYYGVQVEAGSTATAFQTATGTIQGELAACQRYYFRSSGGSNYAFTGINGMGNTTTQMMGFFSYPVAMRIAPSSVDYSNIAIYDTVTVLAVSSITISDATTTGIRVLVNTATASVQAWRPNFVINNNNTAGYLALNAEL